MKCYTIPVSGKPIHSLLLALRQNKYRVVSTWDRSIIIIITELTRRIPTGLSWRTGFHIQLWAECTNSLMPNIYFAIVYCSSFLYCSTSRSRGLLTVNVHIQLRKKNGNYCCGRTATTPWAAVVKTPFRTQEEPLYQFGRHDQGTASTRSFVH